MNYCRWVGRTVHGARTVVALLRPHFENRDAASRVLSGAEVRGLRIRLANSKAFL